MTTAEHKLRLARVLYWHEMSRWNRPFTENIHREAMCHYHELCRKYQEAVLVESLHGRQGNLSFRETRLRPSD